MVWMGPLPGTALDRVGGLDREPTGRRGDHLGHRPAAMGLEPRLVGPEVLREILERQPVEVLERPDLHRGRSIAPAQVEAIQQPQIVPPAGRIRIGENPAPEELLTGVHVVELLPVCP